MQVKILDIAEKDLENSFNFYEKQSTGLGSYFLDTIYSEIDSLSYFGGMHNKTNGFYRLITNKFPFAIYYKIYNEEVIIYAILHCRRNSNWIDKQLEER